MILGIISDTHSLNIPPAVIQRFQTVDLIVHAGDICDVSTFKRLKSLKPLKAVAGNMDDAALKKNLPLKEVIICDNIKLGLTHGHIGPHHDALKNAMVQFKDEDVDVVIFGHSHQALKEKRGGTLYFNPGSPNDLVRAPFLSYGLITCKQGKVQAEIVKI